MSEMIWIKHTDDAMPASLKPGQKVCYRLRDGSEGATECQFLDWSIEDVGGDIVEWFPFGAGPIQRIEPPAGPTGVEKQVCDLIAQRQKFGLGKYGVSVADNPLALREWLEHALLETLDKAIYLQRAINEIDSKADDFK